MLEHTVRQAQSCEEHITAHFTRLRQFLLQEEESQLSALRKEREEKTRIIKGELKQLEDQLSSLCHSIDCTEQQLQGHSSDSSLRELMESLVLTDEPELRSGLFIDQASVLGNLDYRVWRKMETRVNYSRLILDPNTAHRVHVSEDLSVRQSTTPDQLLPLSPERFTSYPSVLGWRIDGIEGDRGIQLWMSPMGGGGRRPSRLEHRSDHRISSKKIQMWGFTKEWILVFNVEK